MRFVLEHFEELLPIAIFLIVMIYSAVGNKKRPPAPEQEEDEPEYQYDTEAAPPSYPPPQPARTTQGGYGEPADNELRRALDDIFKAKRPQPPTPAPAPRHTDNEWHETVANRKIKDAKKAAAKAEAKAAQRAADRAPSPTPDALALAMQAAESADSQRSEYASAEQARTGIIWSEILQRPVALR